jgi:hypothetical protein
LDEQVQSKFLRLLFVFLFPFWLVLILELLFTYCRKLPGVPSASHRGRR